MAIVIPNGPSQGETEILDKILKYSNEDFVLKLFQNNITPSLTTILANLTEATFTNYVSKTLTRANWGAATKVSGVSPCVNSEASSTYNTEQLWTCGTTGNTIYGYYVVGLTSGRLLWLEKFSSPRPLNDGDIIRLTPKFRFRTQIPC